MSDTNTDSGDAAFFDIDSRTGQIKVRRETTLNYEADKNSYGVTVKAKDPSDNEASIAVTISVLDVNETPELTLGTIAEATGDLNSGFTHPERVGGRFYPVEHHHCGRRTR